MVSSARVISETQTNFGWILYYLHSLSYFVFCYICIYKSFGMKILNEHITRETKHIYGSVARVFLFLFVPADRQCNRLHFAFNKCTVLCLVQSEFCNLLRELLSGNADHLFT